MKRVNLQKLEVKSFITTIDNQDTKLVNGGSRGWSLVLCPGGLSLATCPPEEGVTR